MEFSDEYLGGLWEEIDWDAAAEKLAAYQKQLTTAAIRRDENGIEHWQKKIVRDLDVKCLAVRHVASSGSGPGVDRVRWQTSGEKMRAAMSLTSKDYHAQPLRQIVIKARNTGKDRRAGLPTYHDRAMNVLYGYSLLPVTEAWADRKSFAFRKGRTMQDALSYVTEALSGPGALDYVVVADVEGCYAHIHQSWLIEHVPMDKRVLREFLGVGIVFAGELFPSTGEGISEGSNLSPYLGNFTLDGIQRRIYDALNPDGPVTDYANGNMVRFADDIFFAVRTKEDGERVLAALSEFLGERGLNLSERKTHIVSAEDGFVFLGHFLQRKNGFMITRPSDKAVERFISNMRDTILTHTRSQRALIELVNQKLRGWANFYKYCDAEKTFREVDVAVQSALLEAAIAKHPHMDRTKLIAKYWYKESDGRNVYALKDDKSVRVFRLSDTILLHHKKVKTSLNPFLEPEYVEARSRAGEIEHVTSVYLPIWERQGGKCYYCGRPILPDQGRTLVQMDLRRPPSVKNSAYIHKRCEPNEFELKHEDGEEILREYDVKRALEDLSKTVPKNIRVKKDITPAWRHYGFKAYLAECKSATVTLRFSDIEKLDKRKFPATARTSLGWWYPRGNCNTIAEAWLTEGYTLKKLDLEEEKIILARNDIGAAHVAIPDVILTGKIPRDAVFELERFMDYIIKKYGLKY